MQNYKKTGEIKNMTLNKTIITFLTISSIISFNGCIEEEINNGNYDIYVGANINNGYSTIQKAIDNSSKGGSIFIYDGLYNEKIIINKSININGESNGNTIIYYKGNKSQEISLITILADNCTIDNLNINNTNEINNLFGIVINSSNNTIINNSISNTDRCVFINSIYNENSRNNIITFNNISNNNYGLYVAYSNNNNISKNKIFNNKEYGIYLLNSNDNTISYNKYFNNSYGLRIKGSKTNEIFNNNIFSNNKGLYFCCGARNNIVYNNNFQENIDWHAYDALGNQWDNGIIGNYWDDYEEKYPNSEINNGIWSIPYNITGGSYIDNFPLFNSI